MDCMGELVEFGKQQIEMQKTPRKMKKTGWFYRNLSNILWSDGENPERCLHVTNQKMGMSELVEFGKQQIEIQRHLGNWNYRLLLQESVEYTFKWWWKS
jgi:hypothetical protein